MPPFGTYSDSTYNNKRTSPRKQRGPRKQIKNPSASWIGRAAQGCINQLNQESIKPDFIIKSLIYSPHLVDLYDRSSPAPIEPHTN